LLVVLTMRRWPWLIDAEGSAVGAGGMGAASSAGALVEVLGAASPPLQPHEGSTAAHPQPLLQVLQQLLQHDGLQHLWQQPPKMPSRPQW
jgi:hypothetical protein